MLEFCQINDVLTRNTFWNQNLNEKYTFVDEEKGEMKQTI